MQDHDVSLEQLIKMKKMALEQNNFKEVERLNKIISFKTKGREEIRKGRKPKILRMRINI